MANALRLSTRVAAVVALSLLAMGASRASDENTHSRNFLFTYDMVITPPASARRVEAWIPVPSDLPGQDIGRVEVATDSDYKFTAEEVFGNRMVHLWADAPGGDAITATLTVEVTRREYSGSDGGRPNPRFLEPNRLVPTDGLIKRLSRRATAGAEGDMAKARAIYDYVTETVSYDKSGNGWGRGDALFACDAKAGNCTDFHALFIAMARAAGIPARFEIGFPLAADKDSGRVGGYHCWAEFYVEGRGWIPVDSSEAHKNPSRHDYYFGTLDPHRVEFTTGRDLVLEPPQKGEPLNYFVYPYIEVDGRPLKAKDRVKLEFSYKNV